jgi:NAD(P)-dependent dehydrogenase (short-subunit alcohol dehydrogenase family)
MASLSGKTAVVVGASRGLGRGIAEAFGGAGARVVAVAPKSDNLEELGLKHPEFAVEAADATDATIAGKILERSQPDVLALVAGASPLLRPIHHHSWESFSLNFEVDVRLTFRWLREAMLLPLEPGSVVLAMSSAAATHGSPMSGGYAGAKATVRFMAAYADEESQRAGMGIRVIAVLPTLTSATELGHATVVKYAARMGVPEDAFTAQLGTPVTPETAGRDFVTIASNLASKEALAYGLTGDGPTPLD